MLQRIAVGFDASPSSIAAGRWALGVADLTGAEVVLIHSSRPGDVLASGEQDRVRAVADSLLDNSDRLGVEAPPRAGERSVVFTDRPGDPTQVLADTGRELQADLLVIGRVDQPQASARVAMAHELVHRAETCVAIIPEGTVPVSMSTRWIIDVDGGHGRDDVLQFVRQVAVDPGLVTPVLAHDPAADSFPHPQPESWTYPGEVEARAVLEQIGVDTPITLAPGDTAELLERVSAELGDAVVVCGTRHDLLGRLGYHGHTANQLLETRATAVVVVPAGAVRAPDAPIAAPRTEVADAGTTPTADIDSVADAALVQSAERSGGGPAQQSPGGGGWPAGSTSGPRTKQTDLAALSRPVVRTAALGAVGLGAVALVVCLVLGAAGLVTLLVTVGGVLVGALLGAVAGGYRSIALNADLIDLRSAPEPVDQPGSTEHAAEDPGVGDRQPPTQG